MSEKKFVKSCLCAKASKSLADSVKLDLEVEDPTNEKTIAALVGEHHENCDNDKQKGSCKNI
jgi:hypothetical protein